MPVPLTGPYIEVKLRHEPYTGEPTIITAA